MDCSQAVQLQGQDLSAGLQPYQTGGEGRGATARSMRSGRLYFNVGRRPVTTSMPVCAQKAPFVPMARLSAVGQLVQ